MKNRVDRVSDQIRLRNVLLSVSNKDGLESFLPALLEISPDIKIYSTGGSYTQASRILGDRAGKNLVEVSEYTGQPETQGGLVKTLDFKVHLGILTEEFNDAHQQDLDRTGALRFDLVVVNLYPFRETVARQGSDLEDARGNIDIGGPSMLRGAAKNFLRVAAICDPADYPQVLSELQASACLSLETRFQLAKKAFAHTADYDRAISDYFSRLPEHAASEQYHLL